MQVVYRYERGDDIKLNCQIKNPPLGFALGY